MGQWNFLWLGGVIALSAFLVWLLQDAIPFWMLSILLLLLGAAVGNVQRKLNKSE
ncbi:MULTISPECIES: hypothetical protein [unclassified Exiguobacterium]|uniref:hypothetical protein n=1 Tax=unclassified Exiguobacterium TaxID=2644629 RepID=UPI000B0BA6DF|nr:MULTISPECIES: hypothetical protein [unclassified Exiguobacterium]